MTIIEILDQNLALLLLGMGAVVLIVWRIVINTKRKGSKDQEPSFVPGATGSALSASAVPATGVSRQTIAAITAAVNEYQKAENKE